MGRATELDQLIGSLELILLDNQVRGPAKLLAQVKLWQETKAASNEMVTRALESMIEKALKEEDPYYIESCLYIV